MSRRVKTWAYGDHIGDGLVQVSFSLPHPLNSQTRQGALHLAQQMGLEDAEITHSLALSDSASYFIIYGRCRHAVAIAETPPDTDESPTARLFDLSASVDPVLGRRIVIVGAATGTDTHSIGLDAILNRKGYLGNPGLESFPCFLVYNLGSQVDNETLLTHALNCNADVLLISQTVTQQGLHKKNLSALVELLRSRGLQQRFLLICGGPRLNSAIAKKLGFDTGFSKGTIAADVAKFVIQELRIRQARRHAA